MCSVVIALVLSALVPAEAPDVTATRLDGTPITGALNSWEGGQLVVATADGEQRLATDQLLLLEWKSAPPKPDADMSSTSQVELVDGTLIPIDDFRSSEGRVIVTLTAALPSDEKQLTLPKKQVAAVRSQPLTADAAEHWREIRDLDLASDVLVLLKRDGKSLDYVEGVLGNVSPDKIEFKLDREPLRIDRAKVAGFIYYRGQEQTGAEPRCIVQGRSGLRASVSLATLADGLVHITTAGRVTFKWPLDDIYSADFSAGKLLYLGDVEPASERCTPLVGLPSDATLAAEYGRPRRNQSAYGGPLTLRLSDGLTQSPTGQTRSFNKGLALRSRTELVYRVPPGFRRFTTTAGIDPSVSAGGNVRLEIYGDDRLLLEDDVAGHEPPREIELDISGVKRLKILVDYGHNLDNGDWLNLCDARMVK
ncbi:MAG: NPCBM/NEW2 domain-containing protein [Pirellulales bacterium]